MSATPIRVLWVDDDSPPTPKSIEGFEIRTAPTCKAAFAMLSSGEFDPSYVVVDAVLPQQGWPNEAFLREPGIEFIRYLKNDYEKDVRSALYTIVLGKRRAESAKAAGADFAMCKEEGSLMDVIQKLSKIEPGTQTE